MCVCIQEHTCVCVWRSEDNMQESFLSYVGPRFGSRHLYPLGHFAFLSPAWWLHFTIAASVTPYRILEFCNVCALNASGFFWDGPCCPWGDEAQSIHQLSFLTWKKNTAVVKVSGTPSNLHPVDSVLLAKTKTPLK